MKKLKLILTSSAILIAAVAAIALREKKQENISAQRLHVDSTASPASPCK